MMAKSLPPSASGNGNRAEREAKAHAMRAEGWSYQRIADALGVHAKTVRRWLIPEEAEADRLNSLAWKHNNEQRLAEYNHAYKADPARRGRCEDCGELMGIGQVEDGICKECRSLARARRALQIEEWWAEGIQHPEIARRLGWTEGHLSQEMDRMRRDGYDLPYRYRLRNPRHKAAA